jgi:hypothetical protein
MYEIIKAVIESGRYELSDMLTKIDTVWIQGDLTDEQKTELVALARRKAIPENSYAGIQSQLDNLYINLGDIALAIQTLSDRVTVLEGGAVTPPETEEYPAWIQPTGKHDAYNAGDKMTYTDGKRYICQVDGCVWGPDVYPQGWIEAPDQEIQHNENTNTN